eukprot:461688_1
MVDYSKWDKLAALISSSDEDEESNNVEREKHKYDAMLKDKFNKSYINTNKIITDNEDDMKMITPPKNKASNEILTVDNGIDDDIKSKAQENNTSDDVPIEDVPIEIQESIFEFHNPILQAADQLFDEYKTKYAKEIREMKEAHLKIKLTPTNSTGFNVISTYLLNIIFEFAINPNEEVPFSNDKDKYNAETDPRRFPIILQSVCKNWRETIIQNDEFFEGPIEFLIRGGKCRGMNWKKLCITPAVYLNKFCQWYYIEDMNEKEKQLYDEILAQHGFIQDENELNDEFGLGLDAPQTNIFLMLECIKICRNTTSISLDGNLCDEIFYYIRKYCNNLTRFDLSYCRYGNVEWFRHFNYNEKLKETLWELELNRSYWINDQVMKYLSVLNNIQRISLGRLYNITAKGIMHLFEGNKKKEMRDILLTRGMRFYNDTVEMMKCIIKNGEKIMRIDFSECEGFTDDCLQLLEDKNALPQLTQLNISYTNCSQQQVDKVKKLRENIEIDFYEREW